MIEAVPANASNYSLAVRILPRALWCCCTSLMPSFRSSPWIRGAPHNGLALAISSMSCLVLDSIGGLPCLLFRDLNLQYSLNPFLCQWITVSGFTMIRAPLQFFHNLDRHIQNNRSRFRILGRLVVFWYLESCWRRARFSKTRSDCFFDGLKM